jgi:hypothetical protein
MEKKPNVFPSKEPITEDKIREYEKKKVAITSEIYSNAAEQNGEWDSIEVMKKRTEEQLKQRDEAMKKQREQTDKYHNSVEKVMDQPFNPPVAAPNYEKYINTQDNKFMQAKSSPTDTKTSSVSDLGKIKEISQPDYDSPFDLIPIPSEGKLYKGGKKSLKVAYLTTADEDILTSPNLLNSGYFLEVLINRKLIEPNIRYRDLHTGDRNAIMIWLRATSYGEMYPVTLLDELDQAFETEIDLNTLEYKKLGAEPDDEGLFDYTFNISKDSIKFKLLSVGDVEDIEAILQKEKEDGVIVNNKNTYVIQKHIIEVNGNRDRSFIDDYAKRIRLMDASKLKEYIETIESGIDLNVTVRTPGGGSISTFLPLSTKFFWPNL